MATSQGAAHTSTKETSVAVEALAKTARSKVTPFDPRSRPETWTPALFGMTNPPSYEAARVGNQKGLSTVVWLYRFFDASMAPLYYGIPAAFAAQNHCDLHGLPWDEMDVLFLAGDTAWKIGPVAHRLTIEAKERDKRVHMGRVNSLRRLQIAEWFGCDTADGTYLKFGPDINLGRLARWLSDMSTRPSLATALARKESLHA